MVKPSGSRCAQGKRIRRFFKPQCNLLEDRCVPAALPPGDLVSWYRAEGNASDFLGVNPGSLQGGAAFATGKVGQAFDLDGVDDYVSIPDSPSLTLSSLTL